MSEQGEEPVDEPSAPAAPSGPSSPADPQEPPDPAPQRPSPPPESPNPEPFPNVQREVFSSAIPNVQREVFSSVPAERREQILDAIGEMPVDDLTDLKRRWKIIFALNGISPEFRKMSAKDRLAQIDQIVAEEDSATG